MAQNWSSRALERQVSRLYYERLLSSQDLPDYVLKCFVIFDLKPGELTRGDIGQMVMYVRMFDEQQRGAQDNPTVSIILCAAKDASIVRYSVLHGNEELFATRYKLVLPSEEKNASRADPRAAAPRRERRRKRSS